MDIGSTAPDAGPYGSPMQQCATYFFGFPPGAPGRVGSLGPPAPTPTPLAFGRGVSHADAGPAGDRGPVTERNTMVVVMTPDATEEDVARVVEKVESVGGEAFVSKGVVRTIIGLVGDIDSFHGLNLRRMPGVGDVHRISDPYKLVSRQHHRERSTVWVRAPRRRADRARTRSRSSPGRARSSRPRRRSRPPRWPRPPARRCCAGARSSRAPRRTPSRGSASQGLEILVLGARGDRAAGRHRGGRRP